MAPKRITKYVSLYPQDIEVIAGLTGNGQDFSDAVRFIIRDWADKRRRRVISVGTPPHPDDAYPVPVVYMGD